MLLIINNSFQNEFLNEHCMLNIGRDCQNLSGMEFRVEHFSKVGKQYLKDHPEIRGILSGGCSDDWSNIHFDVFDGEMELMRCAEVPVLGVCAGHQIMAVAYGGAARRADFGREERFYRSVTALGDSILFRDVEKTSEFWEYHICEVSELPEGFEIIARNDRAPIQGMQRKGENKFGVQFHPEQYDEEHPAGRKLMENFLNLL